MDVKTPELPEQKIRPITDVIIREKREKKKQEAPKKYLDQIFNKKGAFLKKYFEEK
jgi:hypothetical protein